MTKLLQQAFEEISRLPGERQDAVARRLLEELSADRQWDDLFGQSQELLSRMADDALREHRAGRTRPLDPDAL